MSPYNNGNKGVYLKFSETSASYFQKQMLVKCVPDQADLCINIYVLIQLYNNVGC